jgi:hypothetical protein
MTQALVDVSEFNEVFFCNMTERKNKKFQAKTYKFCKTNFLTCHQKLSAIFLSESLGILQTGITCPVLAASIGVR